MTKESVKYIFFIDLILYLLAFFASFSLMNRGDFSAFIYQIYFFIFLFAWLISGLLTNKFAFSFDKKKDVSTFKTLVKSFVLFLGLIAILSMIFDLQQISRHIIGVSVVLGFLLEIVFFSTHNFKIPKLASKEILPKNYFRFFIELVIYLLVLIFLVEDKLRLYTILDARSELLIVFELLIWYVLGSVFHQFASIDYTESLIYNLWGYIKVYISLALIYIFLIFFLRVPPEHTYIICLGCISYFLVSGFLITYEYLIRKPANTDVVVSKLRNVSVLADIEHLPDLTNGSAEVKDDLEEESAFQNSLTERLQNVFLKREPELFDFIKRHVPLSKVNDVRYLVLRSADYYNIEVLDENSLDFFLNLHELNDQRRMNEYLIKLNNALQIDGYFVGKIQTIKLKRQYLFSHYSSTLASIIYFHDFLYRRVSPKLPVFRKAYFFVSKGKNRSLSFAEGLGRLYFCGFKVLAVKEIGKYLYFVSQKIAEPKEDKNPSYGPLIKLRRTGKHGKPINVFKFRTMHPYSEYLQSFVYENMKLKEGGKFNNDFRITYWGKILRKLWIDELPMFINFFRGDLKIVGVRPLSRQYLDLYPVEFRSFRNNFKPGLIPPYYVDMPKEICEIVESEKKYLEAYQKNPIGTDFKYFVKAVYNIFVRKARSS